MTTRTTATIRKPKRRDYIVLGTLLIVLLAVIVFATRPTGQEWRYELLWCERYLEGDTVLRSYGGQDLVDVSNHSCLWHIANIGNTGYELVSVSYSDGDFFHYFKRPG